MPRNDFGLKKGDIKAARYQVLPEAYAHASGDGALPAPVHMIYYAARPLMLERLGVPRLSKSDKNEFARDVRRYLRDHPAETADWQIVFDARGEIREPHTRHVVPLGTEEVRREIDRIRGYEPQTLGEDERLALLRRYPTAGPGDRYGSVLYCEKEGLIPVLDADGVLTRFDCAVASCKGQTVGAWRELADELTALSRLRERGLPILMVADFDRAGVEIQGATQRDSLVHVFENDVDFRWLGLRLDDVLDKRYRLWEKAEPVVVEVDDPRPDLEKHGATDAEIDFLFPDVPAGTGKREWVGRRVELNALTAPQFVEWVGRRLEEEAVTKVVPDDETLAHAWRRNVWMSRVEDASEGIAEEVASMEPPENLPDRVLADLHRWPSRAWDAALTAIVEDDKEGRDGWR